MVKSIYFVLLAATVVNASTVMMTMLVHNSPTGQVRFKNFRDNVERVGLPFDYVNTTKVPKGTSYFRSLNIAYLSLLDRLQSSGYEKGVLCEDDAVFPDNFTSELALTEAAAGDYTILALCSAIIWGRTRPYTGIHSWVPSLPLADTETDPTGRVYLKWPRHYTFPVEGSDVMFSAAPMCILIRNRPEIIHRIQRQIMAKIDDPLDMRIRSVQFIDPKMKMVAQPQLCWENEQGGKVS